MTARGLAGARLTSVRAEGAASILEDFATEMHEAWQRLLGASREVRLLPGADPWVRQTAARILPCIPASGEDLEPLLKQIGLTSSP